MFDVFSFSIRQFFVAKYVSCMHFHLMLISRNILKRKMQKNACIERRADLHHQGEKNLKLKITKPNKRDNL